MSYMSGQWIGMAEVVRRRIPQERDEIARGRQSKAGDQGIFRGVGELIYCALLERCSRREQVDRSTCSGRVLPAGRGNRDSSVGQMLAHGEFGEGLVEGRRRVGQRA